MKCFLSMDEWYPVFNISKCNDGFDGEYVEVSLELFNKYQEMIAEFEAVQKELVSLKVINPQKTGIV